ncbi:MULTISPECIES: thermonuclease family protein [unclassified Shinella]|uniref:thermonuclease family protein n=1 Tax=unclassified Shinella TaxID=2643062 RepID=UPI0006835DBA|nr:MULTISPECIES: thermonuclease family protein [unclassified Shinella]
MLARLILVALTSLPIPAMATEIVGRASVIDGDTIDIQGTRIRFDGIDAPESRQRCTDASGQSYRCGKVSADALDAFLAESRPVSCHKTGRDRDRIVAVCTRADGTDVNRWLVTNGYAIDWPKYSKGRYAEEQRQADAAGAGIWAGTFERPCVVRGSKCD